MIIDLLRALNIMLRAFTGGIVFSLLDLHSNVLCKAHFFVAAFYNVFTLRSEMQLASQAQVPQAKDPKRKIPSERSQGQGPEPKFPS